MKNNTILWFIISLLITAVFAAGFYVLIFFVACRISPATTIDGHVTMPIGQAIYSMAITAVASIVVLVLLFKKMKKKYS